MNSKTYASAHWVTNRQALINEFEQQVDALLKDRTTGAFEFVVEVRGPMGSRNSNVKELPPAPPTGAAVNVQYEGSDVELWVMNDCKGIGPHYHLCDCGVTTNCRAVVYCDIAEREDNGKLYRCIDCRTIAQTAVLDRESDSDKRKRLRAEKHRRNQAYLNSLQAAGETR